MPIRRGLRRTLPAESGIFEDRLVQEWANPTDDPAAPIIVEEPGDGKPTRLFVVWDDWASMSQQDRSEAIMNAYVRAKGKGDALLISVAMGLTQAEAAKMCIQV